MYLNELYGECSRTVHTCANSGYLALLSDFVERLGMKLILFQNKSRHMAVSLELLPIPVPHSWTVPGSILLNLLWVKKLIDQASSTVIIIV